jgi:hypothetical protein
MRKSNDENCAVRRWVLHVCHSAFHSSDSRWEYKARSAAEAGRITREQTRIFFRSRM